MAFVNTVQTVISIEDGKLAFNMDRTALLYVLSFIDPKARAAAARKVQRHMFRSGVDARKSAKG